MSIDAIGFRALAEAEMGDRVGALRSVASIEDVTRPGRVNSAEEWRATIAAAVGQKAEALAHLEQGHPDGSVPDYRWHDDILYELMRDYPPFQEYIRPKDELHAAEYAASRRALRQPLQFIACFCSTLYCTERPLRPPRASPSRGES